MVSLSTSAEIVVDRSPGAIWPYVSNPCNQDEWVDGMRDSAIEGGEPPGLGTVIRGTYIGGGRPGPVAMRITAFETERRLATDAFEGPFAFQSELTLAREGSGARLRNSMTVESDHWVTALMFSVLRPLTKSLFTRQLRKELAQLKAILEGG